MPDRLGNLRRSGLLILALLGGIGPAAPAAAHSVFVFAGVTDHRIQGEVYFRGGTPARDAKVTLLGPGGETLGNTTTDEKGEFTFAVRVRCDHKLIADVGEGHRAEFTVSAEELPDDLPAPGGAGSPPAKQPDHAEAASPHQPAHNAAPPASTESLRTAPNAESLKADLQALQRQIARLQKDLNRSESELRLRDILGGVGYILGIMGLVFYFLGVRRKEKTRVTGGKRPVS
jgi:nickel transport protein